MKRRSLLMGLLALPVAPVLGDLPAPYCPLPPIDTAHKAGLRITRLRLSQLSHMDLYGIRFVGPGGGMVCKPTLLAEVQGCDMVMLDEYSKVKPDVFLKAHALLAAEGYRVVLGV